MDRKRNVNKKITQKEKIFLFLRSAKYCLVPKVRRVPQLARKGAVAIQTPNCLKPIQKAWPAVPRARVFLHTNAAGNLKAVYANLTAIVLNYLYLCALGPYNLYIYTSL